MEKSAIKESLLALLLLLIEEVLLDLQLLGDDRFIRLADIAGDEDLVENEVGLDGAGYTLWKLKMRSSSQTFPKYLSRTSTKVCMSSRTMSSFSSLSTMAIK